MKKKRKKRTREESHAELMATDETYRRLADWIERHRTDAERAAFPLGSEAFSQDLTRRFEARFASYEERRRSS